MHRFSLVVATLCLAVLGAFTVRSGEPSLPATPLDYEGVTLPAHLDVTPVRQLDNQPSDNPVTDEGATLGRVLFYDTRLSVNETVSCGSCHRAEDGFSDREAFSTGFDGGHTARNSMGLAFSRYYGSGRMFWDERAATLEEQVLMPIQDEVEMGMTLDDLMARIEAAPFYADLFTDAFGTPEATPERVSKALSQFVRSMIAADSRYDQARAAGPDGPPGQPLAGLTAQENRGLQVFFQQGRCATCHLGDLFVGDIPRNNGLDATTTDEGAGQGRFKAPSLRNISRTGPYMHDGRFQTLEQVVEHYNSGVRNHPQLDPRLRGGPPGSPPRRLNLSPTDKAALVAFMETLTDESFIADERWSDPFLATTGTSSPEAPALRLAPPAPNPASGAATVRFSLRTATDVTLDVLDLRGRRVAVLARGRYAPGEHAVRADARPLAAGVYVVRLEAAGAVRAQRWSVVR